MGCLFEGLSLIELFNHSNIIVGLKETFINHSHGKSIPFSTLFLSGSEILQFHPPYGWIIEP